VLDGLRILGALECLHALIHLRARLQLVAAGGRESQRNRGDNDCQLRIAY